MLSIETIEKAIELFEGGANESAVAQATGINNEEAKAVADALYPGETERLLREVRLAGVLEAAAQVLRGGRGLTGDGAGDVVREICNSYPGAGLKIGGTQPPSAAGLDEPQMLKDERP
jgi:hypothetical protein